MKTTLNTERIIERLKTALDLKSDTAVAEFLSISKSTLSNWKKRETIDYNLLFSKCKQINLDWLITGEGEMLRPYVDEVSITPDHDRVENSIPLIPMDAFAGYPPGQYSDLPVEDYYHVAEFAKADFLIRVKGDSMTPKLNGGDIVACKKIYERLFFQWHRIYVIYTKSQGVMIKRVERSETDGCIRLVSDNTKYQPFDIPESDISDIALVMGAITLE